MRVGVAGLGKMGTAIAFRLKDAGFEVSCWNRSVPQGLAADLVRVQSPRALCEQNDIVISCIFDDAAATAVYCGDEGLLDAARGKTFVEMSTLRPATQALLAEAVRGAGGAFIECPVGGTTGPARSGELLGFVGGEAAELDRARPVLEKLCRRIELVGPVGAGSLVKLAVNLPLLVFWQAFGEALALVRGLGKDPAWMVQLFSDTAGASNVLKAKAASVAAALAGKEVTATYSIDTMRKDLRTILEQGGDMELALPLASQALAAFDEAYMAGFGSRDCSFAPAFWAALQAGAAADPAASGSGGDEARQDVGASPSWL